MYGHGASMPMPMPMPARPNASPYPPQNTAPQRPPKPSTGHTALSGSSVDSGMSSIKTRLSSLSSAELQKLLEDETQQNKIIQETEQVKQLLRDKESIAAQNQQLADENLQNEPKLERGKACLLETYHELPKIQEQYDQSKERVEKLGQEFSPDTTLALLKTAAQQAEEESENMVEKFLDKDIPTEDFLEQFRKQRTIYNLRKTKSDKLEAILRKSNPQLFHPKY